MQRRKLWKQAAVVIAILAVAAGLAQLLAPSPARAAGAADDAIPLAD